MSPRTIRLPRGLRRMLDEVLALGPGGVPVWLVGGAVRDLLRGGDEPTDLDLAVDGDPIAIARRVADRTRSGFVVLDEDRGVVRVIRHVDGRHLTIDLTRLRAADLAGDLRARDFTINAIAVPLQRPLPLDDLPLEDPLDGAADLANRRLRVCSDAAFLDDPLRIMRAFRLAAGLDIELPPDLLALIGRHAGLLRDVSGERIRDELFRILDHARAHRWFGPLRASGVLAVILPELAACAGVLQNEWHHLDVLDHTIETLRQFELLLDPDPCPVPATAPGAPDGSEPSGVRDTPTDAFAWRQTPYGDRFESYLRQPVAGSRTYRTLLKLACLLHDTGKPRCRREDPTSGRTVFHGHEMEGCRRVDDVVTRLRLAVDEGRFLTAVVKNHMRPGVLIQEGLTDRRLFRYFSETGRDGVAIALMSLADRLAAQGPMVTAGELAGFRTGVGQLISAFYEQQDRRESRPLLTGTDLIVEFRLEPGPRFKEILAALREAQFLGEVRDRATAIDWVRRFLAASPARPD